MTVQKSRINCFSRMQLFAIKYQTAKPEPVCAGTACIFNHLFLNTVQHRNAAVSAP